MRIDALAVRLRPRPMGEAGDLGVRLAQVNARSVWFTCTPVFLGVFLLAVATAEVASWLPSLIVFWLKPWLDRSVLFVLSRAVFGQSTRFSDLWAAQRQVWWSQLFSTLTLRRFSMWRAFTQPIYQLEGQRGNESSQRRRQLLNGQRNWASGLQFVFANVEMALVMGIMALVVWFAPDASRAGAMDWLLSDENLASRLLGFGIYAATVLLVEPFFVAAGFMMYLNRRVALEAWDVEQEFRRAFQ